MMETVKAVLLLASTGALAYGGWWAGVELGKIITGKH